MICKTTIVMLFWTQDSVGRMRAAMWATFYHKIPQSRSTTITDAQSVRAAGASTSELWPLVSGLPATKTL